jgi:hypothetical protein
MRYKNKSLTSQFQNYRKIHRLSPAVSSSQITFVLVLKPFAYFSHYFFFSLNSFYFSSPDAIYSKLTSQNRPYPSKFIIFWEESAELPRSRQWKMFNIGEVE